MAFPEDALQAAVIETLRLSTDLQVFAVPNGGKRNAREAARLKKQGVLSGVSDLVVIWPPAKTAFIELKAPGRISPKRPLACLEQPQLDWYEYCAKAGHFVTVCDSLEGVLTFLRDCGAPVRTTVTA